MEICGSLLLGSCDLKLLKPAPHWKVTLGDPALTRLNNFRIRLLVGCDGLEQDASRFRRRTTSALRSDASCKLCGHTPEDAAHFVAGCHLLEDARSAALAVAPPSISKILPCRVVDPLKFTELTFGTCWIDDAAFQSFCITYLSRLKAPVFEFRSGLGQLFIFGGKKEKERRKTAQTQVVYTEPFTWIGITMKGALSQKQGHLTQMGELKI